ncbi:hypothetical protein IC582_009699 [Cucumis melo]
MFEGIYYMEYYVTLHGEMNMVWWNFKEMNKTTRKITVKCCKSTRLKLKKHLILHVVHLLSLFVKTNRAD